MPSPFVSSVWGNQDFGKSVVEAIIRTSAVLDSPVTRVATDNARVAYVPLISLHGQGGGWTAEGATIPSDTTSVEGMSALTFRRFSTVNTISNEAIQDSAPDLLDAYGNSIANTISRQVDKAFFATTAASSVQPAGILYAQNAQTVGTLGVASGSSSGTTSLTLSEGSRTPIAAGATVTVTDPTNAATQNFTLGATAVQTGNGTLTITSATPTESFPVGSIVTIAAGAWTRDAAVSTNVTIDQIPNGITSIESQGGQPDTVWISPSDLGAIRTQKSSGSGQYMLVQGGQVGDASQRPVEMVGGCQVKVTAGLTSGAIVADAKYALLGLRQDLELDISTEAAFSQNSTVIRANFRADWLCGDRSAFYLIA